MPFIAQRTAPDGTIIEEEIPTPEEEALLASAGGYGPAPIPPPVAAVAPPPVDTSMYAAPVEPQYQVGGAGYLPPYAPGQQYGMGVPSTDPATTYAQNQPTDPYNTAPSGTYPSTPIAPPPADVRETNVIGQYTGPTATLCRTRREDRAMAASAPPMPTQQTPWWQGATDAIGGAGGALSSLVDNVIGPPAWREQVNKDLIEWSQSPEALDIVSGMAGPGAFGGRIAGPIVGNLADDALRAFAAKQRASLIPRRVRATEPVRGRPTADTVEPPFPGAVWLPPGSPGGGASGGWARSTNALPEAPPSEPIPAPPGAGQARISLAAQQALDEAAGRRAMTESQRTAARVTLENQRAQEAAAASLRARAGRTTLGGTPPSATTPAAVPVGAAPSVPAPPRPRSLRGPLIGLGVVGGAGLAASQLAPDPNAPADAIPEPGANLPLQPGAYSSSTNPQSPADWQGATTRSLELMKDYSPDDWYAKTRRAPLLDANGTPRKAIAAVGADDAARGPLYDGIIQGGAIVPVGNDVADEEFFRMLAGADAAPPGWPPGSEAAPIPDPGALGAATEADGTGAVPPPVESLVWTGDTPSGASSGNGRSGGAGGWIDYGDSSGSSGRRSSSWDDFDRGFDGGQDFTWQDFLQQAGGNRRKAAFMARAANRRRRRQRGGQSMESDGEFWTNFPWDRPPTPIRSDILASLSEAFSQAFPNRRQ